MNTNLVAKPKRFCTMILYNKVNQAGKEVSASLNCRGVSPCKVKTQKKLEKSTFCN